MAQCCSIYPHSARAAFRRVVRARVFRQPFAAFPPRGKIRPSRPGHFSCPRSHPKRFPSAPQPISCGSPATPTRYPSASWVGRETRKTGKTDRTEKMSLKCVLLARPKAFSGIRRAPTSKIPPGAKDGTIGNCLKKPFALGGWRGIERPAISLTLWQPLSS